MKSKLKQRWSAENIFLAMILLTLRTVTVLTKLYLENSQAPTLNLFYLIKTSEALVSVAKDSKKTTLARRDEMRDVIFYTNAITRMFTCQWLVTISK